MTRTPEPDPGLYRPFDRPQPFDRATLKALQHRIRHKIDQVRRKLDFSRR